MTVLAFTPPAPNGIAGPPPKSLLHFELRASLGEGGFGQVFEAWDSKLQRPVAIKLLKVLHSGGQSAAIVREAQLAASLRHPAFVKIHSLEDDGQHRFIVMELVHGQTLKQILAAGPMEPETVVAIVRQVAEAMREAHASGLVHGDLKPSNLMREPSGAIRILDFGLATQGDAESTTSLLQADPQGTIAYMAPERLLGAPLRPQCDIYALGVLLYEMATGTRPFAELNGLALAAALTQSSSDLWPYPTAMPSRLVQLVRAMSAKMPERRLGDMELVLGALQGPQGSDVQIAPAPIPSPATAPAPAFQGTRRKLPVRAFALAATAFILIGSAAWYLANQPEGLSEVLHPISVAQEMQTGLAALRAPDADGRLERAETSFGKILRHDPKNAAAAAGLALVYLSRYGNQDLDEIWLRKAQASAQLAAQQNDQLALAHAATSLVQSARGKWQAALDESGRAFAFDAGDPFAAMAKLKALLGMRRYTDAIEVAQAAIARFPQDAVFLNYLGEIRYSQHDYAGAEQAYRESIKLQPDAAQAYANLFAALSWQNRQEEGMQVLQEGLRIRPSAILYGNLGNALFVRGDYVNAAAAFEHAVAPEGGDPSSYLGWANLADTLLWIPGRAGDARAAYQKARDLLAPRLARETDNFTLLSRMSLYCARAGDKTQAQAYMQQALALAPKNASVHFRAALASELLGDRKTALKEIDSAIALGYPVKLVEAEPDLLPLRRDADYLKRH